MPDISPERRWLSIVGIGEDGRAGLSPAAAAAIDAAELVVGGARHLALAAPVRAETMAWPSPITDGYAVVEARRGRSTCVLATGDPFHYGVGAELARRIPADEIAAYPQASAFSLACARLGWSLPETALVSLHGRSFERIVPALQPGARVLALSWDETTPARIAALLAERGMGGSEIVALEAMGGPRERIRSARADAFALGDIDPLNVVAIEVATGPGARSVPLAPGRDDAWYDNDGQLTKAEIRAVTLAALAPHAGGLLWDVGAGSGSIGIEWMLTHWRNRAVAVEARTDRAERIAANAARLGAPDIRVVVGRAPEILADLPTPDAVFIGGGATVPGVVETAWAALRPGGRMVANAVTIETEARLAASHAEHGGTMRRLAVSRLEPVGAMHGWRAAMPVTQWIGVKP